MAQIEQLQKVYYCPLKTNRRVDDSGGTAPYQRVDKLVWSVQQLQQCKSIKIRGFPKDKKVKLFRVTVSTNTTEYIVTNDLTQDSTDNTQQVCAVRWKTPAVSPRSQTNYRYRVLPVSQGSHSTQSHCLCVAGLDTT